jgi:hypothetical protein
MANVDALLSLRGLGSAAFCGPPATSSSSWARPDEADRVISHGHSRSFVETPDIE